MDLTSRLIPDYFAMDCFLLTTLEFYHENPMKNRGPDSSFKDVTPESKFAKKICRSVDHKHYNFLHISKDLFNLSLV